MNRDPFEERLRALFGELRARDTANIPPLRVPVISVRRTRLRNWYATAFAATAAGALMLWWQSASTQKISPLVDGIVTWQAPTDELLKTPGYERIRTIPQLQTSVLDQFIPAHSPERK